MREIMTANIAGNPKDDQNEHGSNTGTRKINLLVARVASFSYHLILIVAIAVLSFLYFGLELELSSLQQATTNSAQQAQLALLQKEQAQQHDKLEELDSQRLILLQQMEQALALAADDTLHQQLSLVQAQIEALRQQRGADLTTLLASSSRLQEVAAMLAQAERLYLYEQRLDAALNLYELVEKTLVVQVKSTPLEAVLAQVSLEKQFLQESTQLPTDRLLNRLSSLQQNFQALKLEYDYDNSSINEANNEDFWLDTKKVLSSLFIVTEEDNLQIYAPSMVMILREQLILQIEVARIALLRGRQSLWQGTMDRLYRQLEPYMNHGEVAAMLNELADLQQQQVEMPLARLGTARAQLESYLEAQTAAVGLSSEINHVTELESKL
jgi:uncharacterized protein HemX